MILFITTFIVVSVDIASAECTDIYGRSITPNTHFIPGPDICQLCVCDNTSPKWCKRVLCSPPQNCKSFVMGSSCCDYSCLDNTLSNGEYREEVDRRFIITIIAAIFILTLLLFMVTRFRNRAAGTSRRLLQHRQLAEDGRNLGSIGFITGSIGYLNLPNGHHFDDHPLVHFPLYKPHSHYFPRGEAPPPYDEAVADTPLNVAYTSQFLMNERNSEEIGVQRRRSNSEGLANFAGRSRIAVSENCVCDSRQPSDNSPAMVPNEAYNSSSQHRSIPSTVCAKLNPTDQQPENKKLHQPVKRICQVHRKSNANKNESTGHRSSCSPEKVKSISSITSNTEPSQTNLEISSKNIISFQHRTLPLSASLSSPLPSTSDSFDRQTQFATFSSVVNISSSDGDEPPSIINDLPAKYLDADNGEEQTSQLVDDYHAECENCNLNVNAECDITDDYFSEQETMTLQRKVHEASAIKCNEQSMKVSLTLPTNSRTRSRCSSKNQQCGRRNTKESPHKNKLDFVSSEDENIETETFQAASKSKEQNI